jgi:hypothetical protein
MLTEDAGSFAIFTTPVKELSKKSEAQAKKTIEVAVTMSVILFGTHLTYEHLFDNVHRIESDGKSSTSVSPAIIKHVIPPGEVPINDQDIHNLMVISHKRDSLDDSKKARLELAARWHYKGLQEIHPADEFLCYWIAIEIMAMPDTTNIRPIAKKLATLYGMAETELSSKLSLGRLFDLRGRIVHGGYRGGIHFYIIDCVRSIFHDLFQAEVGFVSRRACESFIKEGKIGDMISEAVSHIL